MWVSPPREGKMCKVVLHVEHKEFPTRSINLIFTKRDDHVLRVFTIEPHVYVQISEAIDQPEPDGARDGDQLRQCEEFALDNLFGFVVWVANECGSQTDFVVIVVSIFGQCVGAVIFLHRNGSV